MLTKPPRWCLAAALLLLNSGCSLLSIDPTLELIKAGGYAASAALNSAPGSASQTMYAAQAPRPDTICIEHNPRVALSELIPAIHQSLARQGVDTRVFAAHTSWLACPYWLQYEGLIAWEQRFPGQALKPYLASATLTLRNGQGEVLASSRRPPELALPGVQWLSLDLLALADPAVAATVAISTYSLEVTPEAAALFRLRPSDIGRRSGARVQMYHMKPAGRDNWDKADMGHARMDAARNIEIGIIAFTTFVGGK